MTAFWPTPAFQLENFKIPVRREIDGNSRPTADIDIFQFIEIYYYQQRLHLTIGPISPEFFEFNTRNQIYFILIFSCV